MRNFSAAARTRHRRGFIAFGKFLSPVEMRLSGLSSRSEVYYPEGDVWCLARNVSKADFYRDVAARWVRSRAITEGVYTLNVKVSESIFFRGALSAVLACVAFCKDELRGYSTCSTTLKALQRHSRVIEDVEGQGELFAIVVGTTLFVYDRTKLGSMEADLVLRLANLTRGWVD